MAKIEIEVPDKLRKEMERSGLDWNVLIRRLVRHLEEEKEMIDWSVKLQRASRHGRYDELKERGLI